MNKTSGLILPFLALALLLGACSPATPTTQVKPSPTSIPDAISDDSEVMTIDDIQGELPDIIFFNAQVLTMDLETPAVEAIAVQDDRIFAIGTNDGVRALAGSNTREIDLEGSTILPGFIDSHSHWIGDDEITNFESKEDIIQFMLANGWTSSNELFVSPDRIEELLELDNAGNLPIRINAYLPVNYLDQRFGRPYLEYIPLETLSPHVRLTGVKFFTDNNWGEIINWDQTELNEEIAAAHQAGWQIAIHELSSTGASMALEGLRFALGGEDNSVYRHRLEHLVDLTDDQLAEIQEQGYIASIQPAAPRSFTPFISEIVENVGSNNINQIFRWRDLYDSGVTVIVSTDFPWFTSDAFASSGSAPDGSPLRLMHEALTYEIPYAEVQEPLLGDQHPMLEDVLRSLTINGAYATFEEDVKGSLLPGKYADLVILSANPMEAEVEDLVEIDVLTTMIAGKVEFCALGSEDICP